MLMRDDILGILNQQSQRLQREFSVRKIGLFGSAVRDQARPDSDIDILVDLAEPTFDHYMDLKFFLEERFGRPVDLVLTETVKPCIRPTVEHEVIYAQGFPCIA